MNKQEDIKKAKKILDANDDIHKIEEILHDSTLFHRKADHLYDELSKKIDYLPYIELGKTANRMNGDIPFKNLNYKYIELDESTFGAAQIHSYAIVIKNKICKNYLCNLMYARRQGDAFDLIFKKKISSKILLKGVWDGLECEDRNLPLDIKRGNISSASFRESGQPILHTAKNEAVWYPSVRYIDEKLISNVYAERGDIVVSRIGKSAGQWCVYSGERIPISDCLFRIKDSDGKIFQKINGKRYDLKSRGVATQYITMSDFNRWISSL